MDMQKIRIFYFVFNFLLVSVIGCTQSKKVKCGEFNNKYPEALLKMGKNKDTGVLINVLSDLINNDVNCIDAYLTRGDLFYYSDKLEKAKNDFRKASVLDTANTYAFYKLGLLFQEQDLYDSSIYYLQLAINKKKRGDFLVDYNQVKKELASDENKYDIESVELVYRQAVSYYYVKKLAAAFNGFDFCIQNKYRLDKSYLYRGAIYLTNKNEVKGCQDLFESKRLGNSDADEFIKKYCERR